MLVKTTGRMFHVSQITHVQVYPDRLIVYPVDYHPCTLTGPDCQVMLDALAEAGFIGGTTLVNPERVSVIEDAGANARIFFQGGDRVLTIPIEIAEALCQPLEFPTQETDPEKTAPKPARRKKAS